MAGTGTAYPADAVAGSPQYAALQGRNAFSATMAGATTAKPLGGISGVRPGTRSDLITATSSTWTMNPLGCAGYIELESSATNSGYFFAFSGTVTGTVSAAEASARVDLIYIQINDSNTSDGSSGAPRVVMDYQKGTAGAGVPALTAARAFVIAQINVPATGGGSPTVTWVAPVCFAAGGVPQVGSAAQRDATFPSPVQGNTVDRLDLGYQERYSAAYNASTNPAGLGSAAGWYPSLILGEYAIPSGQIFANGALTTLTATPTLTTAQSDALAANLFTPQAAGLQVNTPGRYSIAFRGSFNATAGTRALAQITANGEITRSSFGGGEDNFSTSIPSVYLPAGANVSLALLQSNGGSITLNASVLRIMYLGRKS